jgi:subtilisin-like proprotein convertase family protein
MNAKRFRATPALRRMLASAALAILPFGLQASSVSALCTTCPVRVPDGGAAAASPQLATVAVNLPAASCAGSAPAGGVEVQVDLLHNHVGDLRLRLIAPDTTAYTLIDRLPDGSLSCGSEDIVGSFVGGVAGATAPSCQVRIPAVAGLVQPASSLDGVAAAAVPGGTWSLEIGDHADAGEGLLRSWRLSVYCVRYGLIFSGDFED